MSKSRKSRIKKRRKDKMVSTKMYLVITDNFKIVKPYDELASAKKLADEIGGHVIDQPHNSQMKRSESVTAHISFGFSNVIYSGEEGWSV